MNGRERYRVREKESRGSEGHHAASRNNNSNQLDFLNEPHVSRRFRQRAPHQSLSISLFIFLVTAATVDESDFPNAFLPLNTRYTLCIYIYIYTYTYA
jgi:hypothetical protein